MNINSYTFLSLFFILFSLIGCNKQNLNKISEENAVQISPKNMKAGEPIIVEIAIMSPEGGISIGGSILFPFYMKPWNGLMKGISQDKQMNHLVTATRSDGGNVEVVNIRTNPEWDILSDMKVILQDTPLPEGEKITIQFGNEDQKVVVTRKQKSLFLEVEVDAQGNGEYEKLVPPDIPIAASSPIKLYLVAPSQVVQGESFNIIVYAEDGYLNVCEAYSGNLDIFTFGDSAGTHLSYTMRKWDENKDLDRNAFSYTFNNEGTYYVKAVDPGLGISAISNPVIVRGEKPEKNLYWGEIHVHSQLSDGKGELQDVYRDGYARGLDFLAITDHRFGRNSRGTMEERIRNICTEADRFNRPGEFVAIPAGETHFLPVMHMNLYFDEADPVMMLELVDSIDVITKSLRKNWKSMTVDQLEEEVVPYWDLLKSEVYENHTLAFPHHTMWVGIKPFLDAERTRVIEVYSTHGTSEIRDQENTPKPLQMKPGRIKGDPDRKFSVREVLNDGMRFGFVGGSDSHDGQAGYNAITGVYCTELSRSGIIQSIYEKECYATSSNRTLIRLKPQGKIYHCSIAGDGELDKVEVIYNGKTVYEPGKLSGRTVQFDWTPPEPAEGYFYIKVILNDGKEAAWSSPIWFD